MRRIPAKNGRGWRRYWALLGLGFLVLESTAVLADGPADQTPDRGAIKPEKIFPVVRPVSELESLKAAASDIPAKQIVARPYITGAVLMYAIDTPGSSRFVASGDLQKAGLTPEALDKTAMSNAARLPRVEIQPMAGAPGFVTVETRDASATSRLFDSKFWDSLEARVGGPAAVALPTRDWILAVRLDDAESVRRLRMVSRRIFAGEAQPVTASLVRRDGAGWGEIPRIPP